MFPFTLKVLLLIIAHRITPTKVFFYCYFLHSVLHDLKCRSLLFKLIFLKNSLGVIFQKLGNCIFIYLAHIYKNKQYENNLFSFVRKALLGTCNNGYNSRIILNCKFSTWNVTSFSNNNKTTKWTTAIQRKL